MLSVQYGARAQDKAGEGSSQHDFEAYRAQQRAELATFRTQSQSEFETWQANDEKQFKAFRKEVMRQWGDYVGSTPATWVEYGKAEKTRSIVDFKKGIVTVQVLVRKGAAMLPVAKKQLEAAVEKIVASRGTASPAPASADASVEPVLPQPVLTNQVVDASGVTVTANNATSFAQQVVGETEPEKAAAGDGTEEKYTLSFPLVPDHLARRMAPFVPLVKKYCATYDLKTSQVLAMIHTESYFNPMAASSSNAIGLMQLVPQKGAAEAYQFVTNDASFSVVPRESLFDPETNIRLGCAYLYLLKTRDFGDVTNKDCGMYCSIAGYNGGPACVAYAFTGDSKLPRAIRSINSMNDADKVYLFLVRNLPSAETRQYLENVVQRTRLYE